MAIPTSPLAANEAEFLFEVGPHPAGELAVLTFESAERLSRTFTLEVTLVAPPDVSVDTTSLVGQKATLTIRHGEEADRYIDGLVVHVKSWEEGLDQGQRHRVLVVPSLWKLGQIRRSRIFQGMSVPEIVTSVLADGGVDHRVALNGRHPVSDYCVQYDESDLSFVSRLLEEEGIFFFFEHQQGQHTMVLADAPSACSPLPDEERILFREPSNLASEQEWIDHFAVHFEVRPDAVTLRDYNYLAPETDLTTEATSGPGGGLEIYEFPGGYGDDAAGRALARIRLEEQRVRANTMRGAGVSRRLVPGYVFELDEHPDYDLNAKYLLLSVVHRGDQSGLFGQPHAQSREQNGYRSEFSCIRSEVAFRPERNTRRPVISGPQTAVVVGPAGEEIFTDEYGRVKVQFHWDREGRKDERSSCWIRVSQAWAGQGWGALYLPRIGQEVVVEFLDGDPDRPIITGSVYNGLNRPPVFLPDDKTKSTLRSASSPGSEGFNELRFEDLKGSEEIYLHAQKDLNIVVENDKTQRVGGNEKLQVGQNRTRVVQGSQSLQVAQDDSSTIHGNQQLEVAMNRSTAVGGNQSEAVGGQQSISIGGAQTISVAMTATETVALAKALTVGGAYAITVGAAMNELVGGLKSEEIGGAKTELIGAKKTETVIGSRTMRVGADYTEQVDGNRTLLVGKDLILNVAGNLSSNVNENYTLKSSKEIVLSAEDRFLLKVGSATIEVKKNGEVSIQGAKFEVKASGEIVLKGSKISEN